MIDQILIINEAGVPLYNWEAENKESEGSMLSGFLTAMDTFAKGERGESISKITLDPTTFIFEREQGLVFVILTTAPEHEHLIRHILTEIRETFLNLYIDKAMKFSGNLNDFKPFDSILEQILGNYGYFDYIRAENLFETDETLNCVAFLDRDQGKILYIKAKEYLDRDKLSFQTNILLNSLDRVFANISEENPTLALVISEKSRCLLFKTTEKLVVIQEKKHISEVQIPEAKINEKRLKNTVKKPGKLLFKAEDKFLLFNQLGKDLISNDRSGELGGDTLPPDCITMLTTSKNIMEQIYREEFYAIVIFSENELYISFPISDYCVFMRPRTEKSSYFDLFIKKFKNGETQSSEDILFLNHIVHTIQNFKDFFR